jgi:hypothetical protein
MPSVFPPPDYSPAHEDSASPDNIVQNAYKNDFHNLDVVHPSPPQGSPPSAIGSSSTIPISPLFWDSTPGEEGTAFKSNPSGGKSTEGKLSLQANSALNGNRIGKLKIINLS